jgi:hypothetical protein
MAKKKKSTKPQQQSIAANPKKYIIEAARKIPLDKVLSDYGTHDQGIYQFFVIRKKLNGNYLLGSYLIDVFCLGLKSTTYRESLTESELQDFLNHMSSNSGATLNEIDPNLAFNVIYGGIEYAEDLGFEVMDKDFAITEYILPDVETLEFVDVEFGKNSKPFYIEGPYDNTSKIIATLNKSIGKDEYDTTAYVPFLKKGIDFGNNLYHDDEDMDEPHVSMIGIEFNFPKALNINLEKDKNFLLKADAIESLIDIELNENDFIIYPEEDFSNEEYIDILTYGFNKYVEKSNHTNLYLTISGEGDLEEYKDELVLSFFTTITKDDILIETNLQFPTFMEHFPTLEKHPFLYEKIKTSEMTKILDQLIITFYNNDWDKKYTIETYISYGNKDNFGESEDHVSIGFTIKNQN